MSLAITAYTGLKALDAVYNRNGDLLDAVALARIETDFVELCANSSFPGRELPFVDGPYSYSDCIDDFCLSYGGYGRWREELAKIAGYPAISGTAKDSSYHPHSIGCWEATGGPFHELINFSDCEGVLGTIVLQKLLIDFKTHEEAAKNSDREWFYSSYKTLMEAVRFAAIDGALVFH